MKKCCKNCGYLAKLVKIVDKDGKAKICQAFPGFVDEDGNDMSPNLYMCMKYSYSGDIIQPNQLELENGCDDFDADGEYSGI